MVSFHGRCGWDSKGGAAVDDGDADRDCRDLSVEVTRHEALAHGFITAYLGRYAASTLVSAPVLPDRATEVFRSSQGRVSGHGIRSEGLPELCVFARWDDGSRLMASDDVVAFAGIIGTVCGDATDRLVCPDLVEQIRQHRRVSDVAPGDLDSANLPCFLVNPEVELAPDAPFRPTMLTCVPLAFAFDLDASAIDQQVQWFLRTTMWDDCGQRLLAAR